MAETVFAPGCTILAVGDTAEFALSTSETARALALYVCQREGIYATIEPSFTIHSEKGKMTHATVTIRRTG